MKCNVCGKNSNKAGVCFICTMKVRSCLAELPALQVEAGQYIEPGRSGSGAASAERSIGVNVSALDFSMATELLGILHSWEGIVRRDRRLTPPALLMKLATVEAEVVATVAFHGAHLDWSLLQEWAVEFAGEVYELHAKGISAAKRFSQQPRRIPCPTDDCTKFVIIDVENLSEEVSCFECKQRWTVLRLVALAMTNPSRKFYLDVETISLWLRITEREVYRTIRRHKIEKRGSLYDLSQVIKARAV